MSWLLLGATFVAGLVTNALAARYIGGRLEQAREAGHLARAMNQTRWVAATLNDLDQIGDALEAAPPAVNTAGLLVDQLQERLETVHRGHQEDGIVPRGPARRRPWPDPKRERRSLND